jgi:hypothetical protein
VISALFQLCARFFAGVNTIQMQLAAAGIHQHVREGGEVIFFAPHQQQLKAPILAVSWSIHL